MIFSMSEKRALRCKLASEQLKHSRVYPYLKNTSLNGFFSLSPSQGKDKSQLKGRSSGSNPVLRPEDNAGGSPLNPALLSTVLRCP